MTMVRRITRILLATLSLTCGTTLMAQTDGGPAKSGARQAAMDKDLMEVTIPQLQKMCARHMYSVTEVVEWYIARTEKYNGIYRAVSDLDKKGALATATEEDAAAKKAGAGFQRGPMWGVPMVIKTNTSIQGLVTSDGWEGFILPGHELVAPKDATVVAHLRAAGAVILGHTNMPDFAPAYQCQSQHRVWPHRQRV